ncbi:nitrophenyl compound nitroreductase subunit ArsF family protein [Shewanella youngdeokensis]|uniref:Nitrophenyl compound nitroreductase subunit ArsF family protein n=1 Tax=Shewanella youngdeokensis TaxID=2999068 RepID=A0ABZ0JYN0_9GAMM|nr:nitrophenyl compound nitroreductase subunit ArsF family protein [Shewanella sp. DAU334]
MNAQSNITKWLLLLAVLASLSLVLLNSHAAPKAITYNASAFELNENQVLNVYYFHGNARCNTCKRIEKYTVEALEQAYSEQMTQGQIKLNIINLETAENVHFIQDFQLTSRSVVIQIEQDGEPAQYRRLDRVWELVKKHQAFNDYIYEQIHSFTQESAATASQFNVNTESAAHG